MSIRAVTRSINLKERKEGGILEYIQQFCRSNRRTNKPRRKKNTFCVETGLLLSCTIKARSTFFFQVLGFGFQTAESQQRTACLDVNINNLGQLVVKIVCYAVMKILTGGPPPAPPTGAGGGGQQLVALPHHALRDVDRRSITTKLTL